MAQDIRYSAFQEFVDAHGLERDCAECGHRDWQMLGGGEEGEEDQFMFLGNFPELDDKSPIPTRAFAAYIMYCGHCGVVKPIAAPVVWDWLETKGNG